jgi:hypothetical protein
VVIEIPKLNEMAYEQVELASVPFLTFVANKDGKAETANYSFVLRGYVRHWLGDVWAEYDRVKLLDLFETAAETTPARAQAGGRSQTAFSRLACTCAFFSQPAKAGECHDSEVRKHWRRTRTNFGIDKDTRNSMPPVTLFEPDVGIRAAPQHFANFGFAALERIAISFHR